MGRRGRDEGVSSSDELLEESECGAAWAWLAREKSSIEARSEAESCEVGLRRIGSVWVLDLSMVGSAGASCVLFCKERRVGRFGVDLEWNPVGAGVPLL